MVSVSDGKSNPEPARIQLTMELLTLQRLDTSTPTTSMGPPAEAKVSSRVSFFFIILNLMHSYAIQ